MIYGLVLTEDQQFSKVINTAKTARGFGFSSLVGRQSLLIEPAFREKMKTAKKLE